MVFETWLMTMVFAIVGAQTDGLGNASILRMARLLRLTRMARMVRLFRALPELMVLIKGVYVFAIALRQLTHDTEIGDAYFASIAMAMASLLLKGTIPDQGSWLELIGNHNLLYAFFTSIYVVVSTIMLMNMLLGILV